MIPKNMIYVGLFMILSLQMADGQPPDRTLRNQYRMLAAKGTAHGNPELDAFLRSLTPEEMLICARQGCDEALARTDEAESAAVCGSAVVECLVYYFDNSVSKDRAARVLLDIVADENESPLLRRGIIGCMMLSQGVEFGNVFRSFALSHIVEVERLHLQIINDSSQNSHLRYKAIHVLASLLDEEARLVYSSDPNVRAVAEHTRQVVRVGDLVRAGKLELAPETMEKLTPIEERIITNAALLTRIAGDQNEPMHLRQHAQRMLRSFQSQPLKQASRIDELLERLNEK
jgi:hypothetical protein